MSKNYTDDLITRDLNTIWHPCAQMHDYETFSPLEIKSTQGCYIELKNGQKIIDANSSWWCKNLGHGHPRLREALIKQTEKFEHVILANTTNDTIVELSEKLTSLTKTLKKIMYASDGSCAVEIALKMSLHSRKIQHSKKSRFASLKNSYHGETIFALSVSDVELYNKAYKDILIPCTYISQIPYVQNKYVPLWENCEKNWPLIELQLNAIADELTAIIVEPIVQASCGMQIYSADFLTRLREWTEKNDVHLIADEVMTGLGRTGLPFAFQYANIEPDIACVGKGLTAGWIPMSAVLLKNAIYDLFYDEYSAGKNFLHSHTHSGNALAASVANEVLNILEQENIYQQVQQKENLMLKLMQEIAYETCALQNVRGIGGIVAADLIVENPKQRLGYAIYQNAVKKGALLRPLGNTIYWLPPLNTSTDILKDLQGITHAAIEEELSCCHHLAAG